MLDNPPPESPEAEVYLPDSAQIVSPVAEVMSYDELMSTPLGDVPDVEIAFTLGGSFSNRGWAAITRYRIKRHNNDKPHHIFLHRTDSVVTEPAEPGMVTASIERVDQTNPDTTKKILIGTFSVAAVIAAASTAVIIRKNRKQS